MECTFLPAARRRDTSATRRQKCDSIKISAVSTKETIEVNGETYPVYKMEISNTSHPFYTGKMKLVDTAGRVDKFMSRYAKRYDKKNAK